MRKKIIIIEFILQSGEIYGVSLCSQYRLPQEGEGVAGACSCTDSLQKINHFETLTTFTLILPVWVAVWACPYLPISWKRKMENACNYGTSQWDSAAAVDLFVIICSNVLYRGFQMNNYFSNHQIPISVCLCLCLCVFVCSNSNGGRWWSDHQSSAELQPLWERWMPRD